MDNTEFYQNTRLTECIEFLASALLYFNKSNIHFNNEEGDEFLKSRRIMWAQLERAEKELNWFKESLATGEIK